MNNTITLTKDTNNLKPGDFILYPDYENITSTAVINEITKNLYILTFINGEQKSVTLSDIKKYN